LSFFVQWKWRFPQAWFWAITVLVCLPLDEVKADAMPIADAMQFEEQAVASTNVHHSAPFENASPSGHHLEPLLASSDNVAQDQKRPKADEFLAEEQDKWKKRLAEHPKDESAKFQLAMIAYRRDAPHDALAQFSDLGDSSEVEAVVLACRFNQALCWLAIGELNEELMADAEMDMEALEELESPESCVQTAIELCRTILDYEPHYGQAGGLLEQIWKELYGEGEPDSTSDSENSSSQEEQDETSPDTKEEASNEEEGEEQQESEASSSSSSSDASDEASQAYQMEQLELPPPSLSPQDVIKQQKASQSKRKRGSGKKTVAVEKDW
jgi:hypothetical protein